MRVKGEGLVVLVLCGLALACFVLAMDDAQAQTALECMLDGEVGPYDVGYIYERGIWINTSYDRHLDIKCYYPATSTGEGAEPDKTGAPYPSVFFNLNWRWRNNPEIDEENTTIGFIVSHGIIVITAAYLNPFGHDNPPEDEEVVVQWLLDQLVLWNETSSSKLYGMVKQDAFGSVGYDWGGATAWAKAASMIEKGDTRIKAVHCFGPWIEAGEDVIKNLCWRNGEASLSVQDLSDYEIPGCDLLYGHSCAPKWKLVIDSKNRKGPYRGDLLVADLLWRLGGKDEYRTFVCGEKAIEEVVAGDISLEWIQNETDFFPPTATVVLDQDPIYMETPVELTLVLSGRPIEPMDAITVTWYVNGSADVISLTTLVVSHRFPSPAWYKVHAKFALGELSGTSPQLTVIVVNKPPVAKAGDNATIKEDDLLVFDGSGSSDTPSDSLSYKWSFSDGMVTMWSSDSNHSRKCCVNGSLEVTLTVQDTFGATDSDTVTITVKNVVPELTEASITPLQRTKGEEATFFANATDTESDLASLSFLWDFGDGTTDGNASGVHAFDTVGTYTVRVTVTDDDGAVDTQEFTMVVKKAESQSVIGDTLLIAIGLIIALIVVVAIVMAFSRRRKS